MGRSTGHGSLVHTRCLSSAHSNSTTVAATRWPASNSFYCCWCYLPPLHACCYDLLMAQEALAFEEERKSACVHAMWFIFFSTIYVIVLDLQVGTCVSPPYYQASIPATYTPSLQARAIPWLE